jgi:lipoprotein-anchoring transpeptidase ErfK/SrfK
MMILTVLTLLTLSVHAAAGGAITNPPQGPTPATPATSPRAAAPVDDKVLAIQVALDRAGFSPGALDGQMGGNTRLALEAFRKHRGGEPSLDMPAVSEYAVTPGDTRGPFAESIPQDLTEQASLPALAYTSVLEALAERFHTTPAFLQRLNPEASFSAGESIRVPNVEPFIAPVERLVVSAETVKAAAKKRAGRSNSGSEPPLILQRPDVVVTVTKGTSALLVSDASGKIVFHAPVTTGSERDPLPIGEWKVNGLQFNPVFHYNPKLFWDADPSHSKARIPPGPNNPVGVVWIDISKEHYGIHGTPEPSTIGRAQSHGCVRLTNWDAVRLAGLVKPGTRVVFAE